jgi:hypothetical protein
MNVDRTKFVTLLRVVNLMPHQLDTWHAALAGFTADVISQAVYQLVAEMLLGSACAFDNPSPER